MGIENLFLLKEQYEKELIRAEAKVCVINDLIAMQEPTVCEAPCTEEAEAYGAQEAVTVNTETQSIF